MYIPKHFEETSVEIMHGLIRAHPLATVVTNSANGLNANHIPLYLSDAPEPFGTLRGHVAKANPLLQDISNDTEALVIFHGPDAYITPSWYETKKETGKVVPTWNYTVVHAYGFLRTVDDASWLHSHLEALTLQNESSLSEPWAGSDAPREYIESLKALIVGVEMVVTRMIGKWKVSQNQPSQNQSAVIAGLKASAQPDSVAMAELIENRASNGR